MTTPPRSAPPRPAPMPQQQQQAEQQYAAAPAPDAGRPAPPAPGAGLLPRRIALVGPQAPPSGGMAAQTAQLAGLLRAAGIEVETVPVNPPHPAWVARLRGLRALCRLPPYLWRLWRAAGRAELLHVMANSGWSWHVHAAPAIWIGRLRGKGVLLHYHGGQAAEFLERRGAVVAASLRRAHALIVPSAFLAQVFERHELAAQIVPNIVDLERFAPAVEARGAPTILVARQLEPLYDHATALRAFAVVRRRLPRARLLIAGDGPEQAALRRLAAQLGLDDAVEFAGKTRHEDMPALYRRSDALLNPSLADNQPGCVLEALACGLPVVSTDVGGIPFLLHHGATALLVAPGDAPAMAQALLALLEDGALAARLAAAGRRLAGEFGAQRVMPRLLAQYRRVLYRAPRGLATTLRSALLFPLHERLKRHDSVAVRRQLEQSQWWPAARLEALQLERLRALLVHAGRHVPYYRELYAGLGFDPARVQDLRDLRSLPILRKADIGARRDDFKSALAGPLRRFNTGGSSGEPLVFWLGDERISHDVAAKWRATRWWGVDIGDREAVLWGSPIELGTQDRLRAWRDRLLRTRLLPAFDLSPARLDEYLDQLRRQRPAMLFGYPSALSRLARHARARRRPMDDLGIRVAFVTAERLYDEQRAVIGEVFGCAVANGYGGRDAGFIAHECPEGGMHVTAEDVIVEIVDAQDRPLPAGVSGAIVVTHLATRDFPFIRYATGDVGALGEQPCACGRGLPLLHAIDGRATDFVVAQDGTVLHGLALIYILRDVPQVRAFKIVQESVSLTRVLLVCVPRLDGLQRRAIVAQFRARLGAGVDVVIDDVADIPAEASGKYRYVVSKVTV